MNIVLTNDSKSISLGENVKESFIENFVKSLSKQQFTEQWRSFMQGISVGQKESPNKTYTNQRTIDSNGP
jgi:hypothetical protein